MKQFIVLCATVLLGILIYAMIAGPGDGSIATSLGDLWRNDIRIRTYTP